MADLPYTVPESGSEHPPYTALWLMINNNDVDLPSSDIVGLDFGLGRPPCSWHAFTTVVPISTSYE